MERKSLRQIARELQVSHSYLSQVINGKRPASEKVLTTLLTTGLMQNEVLGYNLNLHGRVAQSVEQGTHKPLVIGSSPIPATNVGSMAPVSEKNRGPFVKSGGEQD